MTQRISDERLAEIEKSIAKATWEEQRREGASSDWKAELVVNLIADLRDERAKVAECIEVLKFYNARVPANRARALLAKLSGEGR